MGLEILKSTRENQAARTMMRKMNIDCLDNILIRLFKRWGIINGVLLGDVQKSWDVLRSVQFIEKRLQKDKAILDLGSFASEILCSLYRIDYVDLTGIDMNPKLTEMPHAEKIKYVVGNFLEAPFDSSSFEAVTAISVIEHGFDSKRLLREVSRLLKANGYFIASVDYWPEKIDTTDIKVFGVDWTIFSEKEMLDFIQEARSYGLRLVDEADTSIGSPKIFDLVVCNAKSGLKKPLMN